MTGIHDIFSVEDYEARPVACSLCQSKKAETLFVRHRFAYQRCHECGLVRVNPQLTPDAIARLYREGYESKSRAYAKGPLRVPPEQERILNKLAEIVGRRGRLLDVGCFEGQFLWAAQRLGWQVTGTEISEAAVTFARETWDLDVHLGTLENVGLPAQQFDAVVFRDVIEHLPNPKQTLVEAARVLRLGGALYIWTPNFDSLTRRLAGERWGAVIFPWHLHYFTPATLVRTIEEAGFALVSVKTRNWLLDFRDRYLALREEGQSLPPCSPLLRRLGRLLDRVTWLFFEEASKRSWYIGAQIELFARKRR